MNVKVNFDTAGNVELPTLVLAYKNGSKIGVIQNAISIVTSSPLADASSISFRVYKYFNDNVYSDWDKLTDFKLLHIPENDKWYSLTVDVDVNDETVKNVNGNTLGESELSQVNLYDVEINTEIDISREDYDKDLPTVFYRQKHPEASLLDRITEKVPNYTIKHVDASLMNIQKTFSFNGISINDAFKEIGEEIGCLILISSGSDENGKPERGIYAYDLEDTCLDCGYRNTAIGIDMTRCPKCGSENISNSYGEDTTIFVTKDNLADSIEYTTNSESVKNCFKLVAGDDLMTATVRACNPNGSDYIWMFSESMKDDMSKPLKDKIAEYDKLYNEYQTKTSIQLSSNLLIEYNKLINKYKTYTPTLEVIPTSVIGYPQLMKVYFETVDMVLLLNSALMPNITLPELNAKQQLDKLMSEIPSSMGTMSISGLSQSTADNIVLSYARSVVYSGFKVEINKSSLSGTTWTGSFVITSYSDKNDTATSGSKNIIINDNYEQYIKQRLDKILNKEDKNLYGITGLFKQSDDVFKAELRKYSLSRLNSFYSACQACIDIMVQAKVSEKDGKHTDVYTGLYVPYLNKLQFISDEIKVRDNEIRIVQGYYNNKGVLVTKGLQQELIEKRDEIQKALNFETFLGKELWNEFLSFRREDEYSNNNYISDGLSNAELFENAKEFISKATKELYKSCHLQHSITSTLKNFLRMKEFSPILDYFELGNWIRIEIDEKIYKLRLIDYEIDYEDLDNISVTFSDVERVYDGYSDLQSIYDKTSSLATSYDSVKHQIDSNKDNLNRLDNWVAKGLDMTNTKIVSNADNQDIMWDNHGLLCREYNDILGDYNPEQLKVINNGIYITDDNWKHTRTGFGQFIYFDPKDGKYREGYGVIADTIVSNIILSEEVGIYNTEKSIEMGKNGIVVTTNTMNKNVFTIQKEYTNETGDVFTERQLYIDDNGNIVLGGGASISWDNITGTDHIVTDIDTEKLKNDLTNIFNQKITVLEQQTDKKAETWYQAEDPKTQWTTKEEKDKHNGDLWFNTTTSKSYIYNSTSDSWEELKTTPPKEVFDAIDGKAQIFISQPVPPYNKGDLWFDSKSSDIMTCIISRESGSFVKSDWEKRNKYTDDSGLNKFITETYADAIKDINNQIDKKAETWHQATDPKTEWTTSEIKKEHDKDLWYNTTTQKSYIYNSSTDSWEEMKANPPKEVFDSIDGKAQIFVEQPKVPYHVGDLWFDSSTSEIMTCVKERLSGTFTKSDWEKKNKYTDDSGLNHFVESVYNKEIEGLQAQIDGQIETYYYDYQPTLTNEPALSWKTEQDKEKHIGDLFFWKSKGFAYRFLKDNTNYVWQLVKDTDVTTALENAQKAQDTADGKRRVFISQPFPPYDIGDLWTQGKNGKLMRCKVAKVSGAFASTDWEIAVGYTDDTALKDFLNGQYVKDKDLLKQQIDGKVQTFRQSNDPSVDWNTPELKKSHIGDLWYKTDTNETFMYNGNSWDVVTGEIPQELWDKVDGKAQIFTTTTPPIPPYHKGDLWFAGANADIKTCITTRESGNYVESDWKKYNKYTDDTKVDDVISGLGFTTNITGTKVISPHIVGGDLKIGNPNSGTYYASIDTSGKLAATGADIKGKIVATEGMIGNFNISNAIWNGMNNFNSGNNGVYLGADGIALGGGKFKVASSGKLTASGVDISGNINAESGVFRGTVYAQNGSFTGSITATSLTLGVGVTINYDNISNKPEIPSVDRFISKDGIVGFKPSDGSTGFKVSSDGLLEASNAIIYGTIYASSGTIGGFTIATKLDDTTHAYGQTLYRQVKNVYDSNDGKTYDYQVGIKGKNSNNETTEATEAAFYVRRKISSEPSWANSEIPFYVRNNGQVYAKDLSIRDSIYIKDGDSRFKVIDSNGREIYLGNTNQGNGNSMFMRFSYTPISGMTYGFMSFQQNIGSLYYSPFGIYKPSSDNVYNIIPNGKWVINETTVNLGEDNDRHRFNCLYVKSINLNGKLINNWSDLKSIIGTGGGTTAPTDRIVLTNRIVKINNDASNVTGLINGTSLESELGSNGTPWTRTYTERLNIGTQNSYVDFQARDYNGLKIVASNTIVTKNGNGFNTLSPGSSPRPRTIAYVNSEDEAIFSDNNCVATYIRGKYIYLGDKNKAKLNLNNAILSDSNIVGNTTYIGIDADGNLCKMSGSPGGSSGTSDYNNLTNKPQINGHTLTGNQTSSTLGLASSNHSHSGYATQTWVKSSFGDTLSISGNVLYLKNYNGGQLSSVTLPSGGGGSSGLTTIQGYHHLSSIKEAFWVNCGGEDSLRLGNNGKPFLASPAAYDYKISNASPLYINANGTIGLSSSSKRYKHDIRKINFSDLSGLYELPIYLYKYNDDYFSDPNDTGKGKDFIGFIAEDVESINPKLVEYKDGKVEMWSHIQMTPALLALIQNNYREIQKLKNIILQLQGELSILKQKTGGL